MLYILRSPRIFLIDSDCRHFSIMSGVVGFFISLFHFLTAHYFQNTKPEPNPKAITMRHIVILGASYAGVGTAHRIFKQTSKDASFKITLISPNTDIYWNMAAPRAAAGVYGDEKVFQPIAPGFKKYGDSFEFIIGTAQSLDFENKTIALADGKTIKYDYLILATGSRTKEVTPFKGLETTEKTKEALHELRQKIKQSSTIVIAGGGPTGIEFAGELAFEYGSQKHIHLVSIISALRTISVHTLKVSNCRPNSM
jgi:NAD(P)H-nitrite reductase large subunit